MEEEAKELFKIIKYYLYDKEYVSDSEIDEAKMYKLAKIHGLGNFLINWSKTCKNNEVKAKIINDYNIQIIKSTNQELELEKMLNMFEKENIETLLVKGITMLDVYPKPYTRPMCDIDILFHESDFKKVSKIMKDFGYTKDEDVDKHLKFVKDPIMLVEAHHKLVNQGEVAEDYFNNIWEKCINYKNYKNVYRLTLEDAYVFCIVHILWHFKYAGIDLKDILDIYLFNKKYKDVLNHEEVQKRFEEFKVAEFEKNLVNIAYKWFENENVDDFSDVEKFILKGENYNNYLDNEVIKNQGKGKYTFKIFFPSFNTMKVKYPILKKVPILLPLMWPYRIVEDIFSSKHSIGERFNKMKLIKEVSSNDVDEMKKIYDDIGITRKD